MDVSIQDKKITCPHCGSQNCFQEEYSVSENTLSSYLCMGCGYTTTTMNTVDSEFVMEFEQSCPDLFKDIRFHDKDTNLIWYPTVLNFAEYGLIFPDGTNADDWKWRAVPVVPISEEEKDKYPIPNEPGKFYETKADMNSSKVFEQLEFSDACSFLNIIQKYDQ